MRYRFLGAVSLVCLGTQALAGDLAAPTLAKFIRVLMQAANQKTVGCGDKEVAGELATLGVPLEADAKVVWADSEKDCQRLAKQGKLVICGGRGLLAAGAAIAVVAEGGRPVLYVHPRNLAATGITMPDSVMKIAKVSP